MHSGTTKSQGHKNTTCSIPTNDSCTFIPSYPVLSLDDEMIVLYAFWLVPFSVGPFLSPTLYGHMYIDAVQVSDVIDKTHNLLV